MLKRFFSGVVTAALVVLLALADVAGSMTAIPAAQAADTPGITLNGTVDEGDPGYLNSKSIVLSSGNETRVNYRLVPGYASGNATGVQVKIFLPSLEYVNGEYQVVSRDRAPSPLGVQGRVSAGGGWNVLSDTTVQGGPIVMEYIGDLGAGVNPAFDIFLTTYNDQTDGPYGGVPEGTRFELGGAVSYEMFNRVPGSSWETPNQLDDESRVSVISSDLRWESNIQAHLPAGGTDSVPIWDRYQYVDYLYSITNTSTNVASNIDGYSVTFDIDSTDSNVNGIIPFDINRWKYIEGGAPVPNGDREDTSGQFVGLPGEGGVLIYDATDWDGVSELTEEIPYTYSGTGMITIDREHGANKQELTPAGAAGPTERKFVISLPLSRQGFPNPPAMFKVAAITNILFAQTANWSKTRIVEREIVVPTYEFSFTHTTQQDEVVYGYETFNEIANLRNGSNAPTFDPSVRYEVDEDFLLDRVTYEFDEAHLSSFEQAEVTYSYVDANTGDTVTEGLEATALARDDATGVVTLTFDVSHLQRLDWDHTLSFSLVDRVEPGASLPLTIKVFGEPVRVGVMTATATAIFTERIASNNDFGEETTYTEVQHETALDASFTVIYPDEVVPDIEVDINSQGDHTTVPFESVALIDFLFGVNNTTAENSTTTLTLNTKSAVLTEAELTLKAALFAQGENLRVSVATLDGDVEKLDLTSYAGSGDFTVALPQRVATVTIDTDALTSDGVANFASVSAKVGHKLTKQHLVTGDIRTYQPRPYDQDTTAEAIGTIDIQLPNELVPAVDVIGVYGTLATRKTTHVGYESTFQAEFKLDTLGVNSPESEYVIDLLAPTKSGALAFGKIALQAAYLDNVTDPAITFVDAKGKTQRFTAPEVAAAEVTLTDIAKIVVSGTNLSLQGPQTIALVEYDADIEIGSSQTVRATFTGTQEAPYEDEKSATQKNQITVRETQTKVKVEGVNQVTQPVGAGNTYSVDIYRWWGKGSTYNTQDSTLDQGYKSLGGFTSTLTRPTETFDNNNQRVSVDVELPYEHFDLYYLKIREDMREYVDSVDVYRMVDGKEVLWKTVPGSDWVNNSAEGAGFWRIGTARPDILDQEMYASYPGVAGVSNHPYYKEAWDQDVRPDAPVSRVDITLEFTREGNDAVPQMAGVQNDVVEYMGRFHSSSVGGKQPTDLTATDTMGLGTELTRTDRASINSLVAYPFAQTKTGANDNTSLANKVITMGSVGEYLASIWNANTTNWSYYSGHGPDVYSPAATEYDEWLGLYDPASFHDELVYEFVYPASPKDNGVYNLKATHVAIANTSTLQYLTGVRVLGENGKTVEISFGAELTDTARFDYDNSLAAGIHDDGDGSFTVSFGEDGVFPEKFEGIFRQVSGFGERTAEIDGAVADTLGASLAEVDVRVGGVVNGNQALKGTTNLYRVPDDTQKKTLLHSTSATLTGYTPKLGASLDMQFDSVKVYDYQADGVTPNTSRVVAGIANSSEADIKDLVLNVKPDANFRSQLVEIPEDIFAGDWSVDSVVVSQGAQHTPIALDEFTLNEATRNYEFDLRALFADGTLTTQEVAVTLGGEATLLKQHVDNIAVAFVPKDDTVGLWGSLTRAESEVPLPTRMRDGGDVFVTGVWVDEDEHGSNWNSKPSFVSERSKGSNEQVMHHSSFNANATVTSYNPIFASAGGGNAGAKPTLTHASPTSSLAPRIYTRVARLQTHAVHLQNDFSKADATHLFYDADTGAQINFANIAVGDTTKVLYELRNVGVTATDNAGAGSLPVFRPQAHIEAPAFMEISSVEATSAYLLGDPNRGAIIGEGPNAAVDVPAEQVAVDTRNPKRTDVTFDLTLNDGESVFFLVEYTATNDAGAGLGATQGKTLQWNTYARPAYAHHFMSYNSDGANGNRVTGTTAAVNFDGDSFAEQLGRVHNTLYRYADPNQLVIESRFDTENVSGQNMTLTVKNIRNEILHDNTRLELFVTLDKSALSGFELTGFPAPTYPAGFAGEFAAPKVSFLDAGGKWIAAEAFDASVHTLREVNQLRVDYGTVPALGDAATVFEAPSFQVPGIGHWKTAGSQSTKSYVISSQATTQLTHQDPAGSPVAEYTYRSEASSTAWKAIPTVEFNLQSFDSAAEARAPYNGAALGKTGYRPGDQIHYRVTAKNHTTFQGTATNTPYGKAPLTHPVIFDKIPEYLHAELLQYVSDGMLDVTAATAAGALEIRVLDAAGNPRPFVQPTATVRTETGLDVAGAQTFANDRHNDGWGRLSSAEPANTKVNPANEISFEVITYSFSADSLGRGEQIEIVYAATARDAGLPVAKYPNGTSVFAPLFGWYGSNVPVANTAQNVAMDMATLLHDAGISGDRGHEMTAAEFLSNSFSWQPGGNEQRRDASSSSGSYTQATYYDASANAQKSHTANLRETATNDLYVSFASAALDENFGYATKARVNDAAVTSGDRILWTQDGMQLNRAWLYGASEMVPDTQRGAWGVDNANFYEHDGSLNSSNRHRLGYTPYVEDDYTYAVQLHEEFTVRLHAANLGDRAITSGLEYTEILPLGISPFDAEGNLLGITAFDAAGAALGSTVEIVQTPDDDRGFRAPAQSQEAGTYAADTRDDMLPYVVKVTVASPVTSLFHSAGTSQDAQAQRVDIRVRVAEELPPTAGDISYWHDELTLTSVAEEPFLEIYSEQYGAFNRAIGTYNQARFPNDGMPQGIKVNDLLYDFGSYSSYFSVEPWGTYIRGLNAQATKVERDGKPALATGDQIAMRKPTLRVWSGATKDSYSDAYDSTIQGFAVDLYEEFTINSTVENQQLEVLGEYNRVNSGYNYYSGDNFNDDIWKNAPQTIGGARGSWFEPTVSIALPYGVAPVLKDGSYARYDAKLADLQQVTFAASVNAVTYQSSVPARDVAEHFAVEVELVEDALGKRFVLHFTADGDRAVDVAYGESLVISPRVVTIDTPTFGADTDDSRYTEVLTFAGTKRPVFNPIVSDRYTTGSTPSLSARDQGVSAAPNNVKSANGLSITVNDRARRDSTSTWSKNVGALKITERLISATQHYADDTDIVLNGGVGWTEKAQALTPGGLATKHDKRGAYGGTLLNLKKPSITNTAKAATFADGAEQDLVQVDAAGKYWYVTEVKNEPTSAADPYEEIKTAGDVHNSRFVLTQFVTSFAEATGEVRIKLGDQVYDRDAFEAMGYSVKRMTPGELAADAHRNRIQWVVTTPPNERATSGQLRSGESFKVLYEVQLVDGYADNVASQDDVWSADELIADSYVSLISDDVSLIPAGGPQRAEDFIVQSLKSMKYHTHASDTGAQSDIDSNGDLAGIYAADTVEIEILKPRAQVRINTTRPRIAYSNGMSGDTYFNSSDTIEYLITHAKNTGSGLKELVIENVLPTDESNDSTVSVSNQEIATSTRYVTSGAWALPQAMLDRLAANGTSVDEAFKTYVYVSDELAEDGYEAGGWELLNPGGTSILTNERFDIPTSEQAGQRKIRVVVKALDPSNYLVPQGTRLDIDADPVADGSQSVLDTDPTNQSTTQYPASVTDNAIAFGVRISSNAKSTLFVYGTAQVWGNYVGTSVSKLSQSETRSYLTPSRPVVNVNYDALYYRSDSTKPTEQRFGWSDVTAIAPKSSPHLKFSGEFINADDTMWSRDEDNTYAEDTLVDPFVTFQLPAVMESGADFTYVPRDQITQDHPLSDEHRSRYSLTDKENNLWTWKLLRADGTEASPDSHLTHTKIYSGPWAGFDRNVVSVWFDGSVFPGDKIVVEFIGSVDAYSPGADAEDLRSRAMVTNNTGLLHPLNSQQNSGNRLGYSTDSNDFNDNRLLNDRLVFSEKSLFQYETYDNFGKRKVAYSDLNRAGTVAPELTPVRQGGEFAFEVSVDNSKEAGDRAYPYPILYDVLPFVKDTSITNAGIARDSQYSAWLRPDSLKLEREGADKKTYGAGEYTAYVGPFTKRGGEIVQTDLVPHAEAASESFYDALGLPGIPSATRDKYFVKLSELQNDPALLQQAKSLLVLFNNPAEQLPGQNKLKLTYSMQAPHNAPAYLEQFDEPEKKAASSLWNSFVATQRVSRFIPQESNNAGVVVTEKQDNVYLGNYVWNDVNYNGEQDEGDPYVDENGRTHLSPSQDLNFDGEVDDPGINGVRVTLLTAAGYNVDALGNPIHQSGGDWVVVDEATGESVLDEVFAKPIPSEGPLVTVTESDIHGNAGYYTFSNITPGDYRVMHEFPREYDRFLATTAEVFQGAGVQNFAPGAALDIPAAVDGSAFVTITEPARVDTQTTDAERMSFDIGVAETILVGGTVFAEDIATLDGYQAGPTETGIPGYHVTLKRPNGETAVDVYGDPMVQVTDAEGKYSFALLPVDRQYTVEVTDENDGFNTERLVSPFVHHADPFAEANDNDGVNEKGTKIVKTGALHFDLEGLFRSQFADRDSVSLGFYEKTTYGVIGNRVFDDLDRDGVQDAGEPGLAGQELQLEQYTRSGDEWVRTEFARSAVSNADGYYYFTQVPSMLYADGQPVETRYQVVAKNLLTGYTFAPTNAFLAAAVAGTQANEVDSDFFPNGTMHGASPVGEHLISVVEIDEGTGVVFGVTDNTVDLGLVRHALSSLSGEVFLDSDRDGVQNDHAAPAEKYTATLEVRVGDAWVDARQDAGGRMIEPAQAQDSDVVMQHVGAASYRFNNLHIIDSIALQPYEYRVRVTSIPLWQDVTVLHAGDDPTLDNDFTLAARDIAHTAVSDSRILGELQNELLPIQTFVGVDAEHVDLGLFGLATQATIGDFVWDDRNRDGVQDAGEPGIPDLRVVLNRVVDGELVVAAETQTDADGAYAFVADAADQDPASARFNQPHVYVVEFDLTSRQTLSAFKAGDDTKNSKFRNLVSGGVALYGHSIADPAHAAVSEEFTLVSGDANGYAQYGSVADTDRVDGGVVVHDSIRVLGDTVYEDTNVDGVQDPAEPGIAGLAVSLFQLNRDTGLWEAHEDADGHASVTTDADGRYEFSVEVADLDKGSAHYRLAEEYRVLITAPANLRLVEIGNVFFPTGRSDVDGIPVPQPRSSVLTGAIALVDSDAEGVVLGSARDVRTADAGFAVFADSVTIGGRMWDDADANGLQDEGETGIAGRTVALWERVGADWVQVEDLAGHDTTQTDVEGNYSFTVSPTHYDEGEANFLAPREYRVSAVREGYQVWSPLNAGDDGALDSDLIAADPGSGETHTGVTHGFSIVDHDGTVIDVTSVRDDLQMDIGLQAFAHEAIVGGTIWDDANEDGAQQAGEGVLAGQTVTLWELVEGEWQIATDARGNSSQLTDADGAYEFAVSPTDYDEHSDGYLLPREYRTAVAVPGGYLLSGGSTTASLEGERAVSQSAQITTLDDAGSVDISTVQSDRTLSFPFVKVALAFTGSSFALGWVAVLILLGLVVVFAGVRRQRSPHARKTS